MNKLCPDKINIGVIFTWKPTGDIGDCNAQCFEKGQKSIDPDYPSAPILYQCLRTTTTEVETFGTSSTVTHHQSTETQLAYGSSNCEEQDTECFETEEGKCGDLAAPVEERAACQGLEECPRSEFRWELGQWSECFDIECPAKYSIQKREKYLIHAKFKDGKFVSEIGINKDGIKRARLEHGDKIPEEPTSALEQRCRLDRICEPVPPIPPPPVGCADYKDKITCCKKQCSWGDIDETGNKCYDKISSSMAYAMSALPKQVIHVVIMHSLVHLHVLLQKFNASLDVICHSSSEVKNLHNIDVNHEKEGSGSVLM